MSDCGWSAAGARSVVLMLAFGMFFVLTAASANADPIERLIERLDRLEAENRLLRQELEALKAERNATPRQPHRRDNPSGFARTNPRHAYVILDPTTDINRKQRLILERRRDGTLAPDSLHVQGAVTAVANLQKSNGDGQVRLPDAPPDPRATRVGGTVSEAAIHSVQLGMTGNAGQLVRRPRGDAVRSRAEFRGRHQHRYRAQPGSGAARLGAGGRSRPAFRSTPGWGRWRSRSG